MRLSRLLRVIDFIFVFNLYYAAKLPEKRSEISSEVKLNCNKCILFLITLIEEIWEYERLFFNCSLSL